MKKITTSKTCLKCKNCCLFEKDESYLSPYFSSKERIGIDKKFFKKGAGSGWQAKLVPYSKDKELLRCSFLDEKTHRCRIYSKRPIECKLWPFVVSWDKERKNIILSLVDKSFCPATEISKVKKMEVARSIAQYFKKSDTLKEIDGGEIFIWPYEDFYHKVIVLKKINN